MNDEEFVDSLVASLGHLSPVQLRRHAEGEPLEDSAFELHLNHCEHCANWLAQWRERVGTSVSPSATGKPVTASPVTLEKMDRSSPPPSTTVQDAGGFTRQVVAVTISATILLAVFTGVLRTADQGEMDSVSMAAAEFANLRISASYAATLGVDATYPRVAVVRVDADASMSGTLYLLTIYGTELEVSAEYMPLGRTVNSDVARVEEYRNGDGRVLWGVLTDVSMTADKLQFALDDALVTKNSTSSEITSAIRRRLDVEQVHVLGLSYKEQEP